MIRGTVRGDSKGIQLDLRDQARDIPEKVLVRSLNRTASSVQTVAGREIRQVYALKAADVRGQIKVTRARSGKLTAEVTASGQRIALYQFGARQRKRTGEVTVKVKRAGGRTVVKGKSAYVGRPFIQRMKSGHYGVFQRVGETRLPIKELFSISLPGAFTSKRVAEVIRKLANERFGKELAANLAYYTQRRR